MKKRGCFFLLLTLILSLLLLAFFPVVFAAKPADCEPLMVVVDNPNDEFWASRLQDALADEDATLKIGYAPEFAAAEKVPVAELPSALPLLPRRELSLEETVSAYRRQEKLLSGTELMDDTTLADITAEHYQRLQNAGHAKGAGVSLAKDIPALRRAVTHPQGTRNFLRQLDALHPEANKVFLGGDGIEYLAPAHRLLSEHPELVRTHYISRLSLATPDEARSIITEAKRRGMHPDDITDYANINLGVDEPIGLYAIMDESIRAASASAKESGEFYHNLAKGFATLVMDSPADRNRAIDVIANFVRGVNLRKPVVLVDIAGRAHVQPFLLKSGIEWLGKADNWASLTDAQRVLLGNEHALFRNARIKVHLGITDAVNPDNVLYGKNIEGTYVRARSAEAGTDVFETRRFADIEPESLIEGTPRFLPSSAGEQADALLQRMVLFDEIKRVKAKSTGEIKEIENELGRIRFSSPSLPAALPSPSTPFPVTIPPGAAKFGFTHLEELERLSAKGKFSQAQKYLAKHKSELLPENAEQIGRFLERQISEQEDIAASASVWLRMEKGQAFLATEKGREWYDAHKKPWWRRLFSDDEIDARKITNADENTILPEMYTRTLTKAEWFPIAQDVLGKKFVAQHEEALTILTRYVGEDFGYLPYARVKKFYEVLQKKLRDSSDVNKDMAAFLRIAEKMQHHFFDILETFPRETMVRNAAEIIEFSRAQPLTRRDTWRGMGFTTPLILADPKAFDANPSLFVEIANQAVNTFSIEYVLPNVKPAFAEHPLANRLTQIIGAASVTDADLEKLVISATRVIERLPANTPETAADVLVQIARDAKYGASEVYNQVYNQFAFGHYPVRHEELLEQVAVLAAKYEEGTGPFMRRFSRDVFAFEKRFGGITLQNREQFGITHPHHYLLPVPFSRAASAGRIETVFRGINPDDFDAFLLSENIRNLEPARHAELPVALVINNRYDWNRAFENKEYITSLEILATKYKLFIVEVDNDADAFRQIERIAKLHGVDASGAPKKPISVLVIGGHGNRETLDLGYSPLRDTIETAEEMRRLDSQYLSVQDGDKFRAAAPFIEPNGEIALIACSTGKGGACASNLATTISTNIPQARVHAPTIDTHVETFHFEEGVFKGVTFRRQGDIDTTLTVGPQVEDDLGKAAASQQAGTVLTPPRVIGKASMTEELLYNRLGVENAEQIFYPFGGQGVYGGKAIATLGSDERVYVAFAESRGGMGARHRDIHQGLRRVVWEEERAKDITKVDLHQMGESFGFQFQYDPSSRKIVGIEHSSQLTEDQTDWGRVGGRLSEDLVEKVEQAVIDSIDPALLDESILRKPVNKVMGKRGDLPIETYDELQVRHILGISGDAYVRRGIDKIADAYKAEVGFLDSGAPTPQLSRLVDEGVLTPEELEKLRRGAPMVMGGMTEDAEQIGRFLERQISGQEDIAAAASVWLKTPDGKAFLATPEGRAWYDAHKKPWWKRWFTNEDIDAQTMTEADAELLSGRVGKGKVKGALKAERDAANEESLGEIVRYLTEVRGISESDAYTFLERAEISPVVSKGLAVSRQGEQKLLPAIQSDQAAAEKISKFLSDVSLDEIMRSLDADSTSISYVRKGIPESVGVDGRTIPGVSEAVITISAKPEGGFAMDYFPVNSPTRADLEKRIRISLEQIEDAKFLERKLKKLYDYQTRLQKRGALKLGGDIDLIRREMNELGISTKNLNGEEVRKLVNAEIKRSKKSLREILTENVGTVGFAGYRTRTEGGEFKLTDAVLLYEDHLRQVKNGISLIQSDIAREKPALAILSGRGGDPYGYALRTRFPDMPLKRVLTSSSSTSPGGDTYQDIGDIVEQALRTEGGTKPLKVVIVEGAEYSGSSIANLKSFFRNRFQTEDSGRKIEIIVYTLTQNEEKSHFINLYKMTEGSDEFWDRKNIRFVHRRIDVDFVLGEDSAVMLGTVPKSHTHKGETTLRALVPLVLFDDSGRIVDTIKPLHGSSTSEEFSRLIAVSD